MSTSPRVRTPKDIEGGNDQGEKRCSVISQLDSQVTIAGVDLSYTVPTRSAEKEKRILRSVSALFKPGRLTAVMGASGAGKTSLLYAMAGEISSLQGKLLVNGQEMEGRRVREISGFVFQEDVLLDTMTVREAVWMSATLRLKGTKAKDREALVDELLEILRIESCQHTIIGSATVKGISGGERKRCAIAMELITNPPVLFLDEPTSGLDTKTAFNVVATLHELAHQHGRTIIATIHQPSSDIYHLFDDLLLLGEGQVLYCGPADGAIGYFAGNGYPCPQYTNPADYFFMHVPGGDAMAAKWKASRGARELDQMLIKAQKHPMGAACRQQRSSRPEQFAFLFVRALKNAWRNKMILQVKVLQNILVGLLTGLIYYDTDSKSVTTQVQDRNGALYFIVVSQFFGASMGFVSVFSTEKAVFLREYGAGYYSIVPYFFSKILIEVPVQVVCPVIFVSICYYMIGLQGAFHKFASACMVAVATALSGMAVGTVAGAAFPDINMALVVLPLILLPLMMFSGLFVNVGAIPIYFSWIKYISPMKYAYNALMKNEYLGLVFRDCDPAREPCSGDLVLQQMSMDGGLTIAQNIGVLFSMYTILIMIGFFSLAILAMRR